MQKPNQNVYLYEKAPIDTATQTDFEMPESFDAVHTTQTDFEMPESFDVVHTTKTDFEMPEWFYVV